MPISLPAKSPADPARVLIAAQSGRSLAAAARRAGYLPLVADMFGDMDTLEMAAVYRPLSGRFGAGIRESSVLPVLEGLAASVASSPIGVVLGSGFEASPAVIDAIDRRFGVIGASAAAVRDLKDPVSLAALLKRLHVPHPRISLESVSEPAGLLQKRRGGSGGGHIRVASPDHLPRGFYLQERVDGRSVAIAFLADGESAVTVATTEQWTSPSRRAPWRYGGAVEPGDLAQEIACEVEAAIQGIVRSTGLRGLASADILVDGRRWWMLEINPRPGATMDVLDRRARPLFQQHIDACRGILSEPERAPGGASGTKIVYARRTVPVVPAIDWPTFVMDRPQPNSTIRAGAPICTVAAVAPNASTVRLLLDQRESEALGLLYNGRPGEGIVRAA
jgi:predicted ATP-grasp superfamily ATP-dependent carboligase